MQGAISNNRVSIRAPAWGATTAPNGAKDKTMFQFALPRGERLEYAMEYERQSLVSIRAPAWGATALTRWIYTLPRFQFALPRGERLEV